DGFFGGVDIAVGDVQAEVVAIQEVGDVGGFWAEEENGPRHGHGAVNFAGVDDADHVGAEGDDVDVGGGEGEAKIGERLIRKRNYIRELVIFNVLLDFFFAGAAADE